MRFENPDILYALLLLLIPIIIHLVKWRKYKTVFFTNVDFLHDLEIKSRKSRLLKELLILFFRLLIFTALVLAFAKPYKASQAELQNISKVKNLVYLDNSMSIDALTGNTNLWQEYIQDFQKKLPGKTYFTLLTNDETYQNISRRRLNQVLSHTGFSAQMTRHKQMIKKIDYLIDYRADTQINVLYASDMQNVFSETLYDSLFNGNVNYFFLDKHPVDLTNISIDSLWETGRTADQIQLNLKISANKHELKTPVQILKDKAVLWRSFIDFKDSLSQQIKLTLPLKSAFAGKVSIVDKGFQFDNQLFFTINRPVKNKILIIGKEILFYLKKIYTDDEFVLDLKSINQLDQNLIHDYDLLILTNTDMPKIYMKVLKNYVNDYGHILIIPDDNTTAQNLTKTLKELGIITGIKTDTAKVFLNQINFDHPLFNDVFAKKVQNFAYPFVKKHFKSGRKGEWLYKLSDQSALAQVYDKKGKIYLINAPLNSNNTDLTQAASLIVPLFYQIGTSKSRTKPLYYILNQKNEVFIKTATKADQIIHIKNASDDFIPFQINQYNGVNLVFDDLPNKPGIYDVVYQGEKIESIAFNADRRENTLSYLNLPELINLKKIQSVQSFATVQQSFFDKQYLWQWFLILALLFLLIEMLLLRYWKA